MVSLSLLIIKHSKDLSVVSLNIPSLPLLTEIVAVWPPVSSVNPNSSGCGYKRSPCASAWQSSSRPHCVWPPSSSLLYCFSLKCSLCLSAPRSPADSPPAGCFLLCVWAQDSFGSVLGFSAFALWDPCFSGQPCPCHGCICCPCGHKVQLLTSIQTFFSWNSNFLLNIFCQISQRNLRFTRPKIRLLGLPWQSIVKILSFHCRGRGFNHWLEN